MQSLNIKRELSIKTKNSFFEIGGKFFFEHILENGEVVITDIEDYSKIYSINAIDSKEGRLTGEYILDEETRLQGLYWGSNFCSLHITENDEVIITDNNDYNKILMISSLDFYNFIERCEDDGFESDHSLSDGYSVASLHKDNSLDFLYKFVRSIEDAELLAQLAMTQKESTDDLIVIFPGSNIGIDKNHSELYEKALMLAKLYKDEEVNL